MDALARFIVKVDGGVRTDDCWLWTGEVDPEGYGRFSIGRRRVRPHRWSYEYFVGPVPEGLVLDHLCRVRNCVNPEHLEPVTQAENMRRGVRASASHCRKCGTAYDKWNTVIKTDRRGRPFRACRTCRLAHARRWRAVNGRRKGSK